MHAACLSLMLMAATPGATDAPVVVLAEGKVISAIGWSIGAEGELVLAVPGEDEAVQRLVVRSPALLDADVESTLPPRRPPAGPSGAILQLTSGEILLGTLAESGSPGSVLLDTRELGPLSLPLETVAAIRFPHRQTSQSARREAPDPPYLVLTNGDVLPGTIKSVTPDTVTIDSPFGETATEITRVAALALAPHDPPADERVGTQHACTLTDGQRWYVDAITAGPVDGEVRLHRGTQRVLIPRAHVRRIVFPGWTVRELTALKPSQVETTPYLDEKVRLQIDDDRQRRPRAIGGQSFLGGMTARPRSRVTYALDSPAACLVGHVGMDPLRGSEGICSVRVESDGTTLFSRSALTARTGACRIAVPTAGLGHVTLTTDFGPKAEIGDCVNWCELVLVQKKD